VQRLQERTVRALGGICLAEGAGVANGIMIVFAWTRRPCKQYLGFYSDQVLRRLPDVDHSLHSMLCDHMYLRCVCSARC
jgi:hypothetical protein